MEIIKMKESHVSQIAALEKLCFSDAWSENSIRSEIEDNRFFLEYQPVIDAKTGEITGAEVLARLNSATEGILTPGAFLSAVNNVGLNKKFDYYIFEKNCKWIASDKENRVKYVYAISRVNIAYHSAY